MLLQIWGILLFTLETGKKSLGFNCERLFHSFRLGLEWRAVLLSCYEDSWRLTVDLKIVCSFCGFFIDALSEP